LLQITFVAQQRLFPKERGCQLGLRLGMRGPHAPVGYGRRVVGHGAAPR